MSFSGVINRLLKIPPKSKFFYWSHSGEDTMAIDFHISTLGGTNCLCHANPEMRFVMCAVAAAEWEQRLKRWDEVIENLIIKDRTETDEAKYIRYQGHWEEAVNQADMWREYGSAKL